ncbi:MarR family transcriptional regulator [Kineococcus sp. R8]|uniref:MarR family winged helix-turn-helix transcriptional regulator n=1 Tax=Kineococcus siccus TaxID=2696567 RepID=UPI0014121949|nr:MarR family transcriptional regulator [Kineococcus siccus]NAZ83411.1 MarR family transcriptional regulator [Kineococcus siccus]
MPDGSAPAALTPQEEEAWRALMRLMVALPRAIDEDLLRRSGLGLTRYVVLMRLSEAPERTLRMSELAEAASISPSRMTRVAQSMAHDGLLSRSPDPTDARAALATLTDAGRQRLEEAWPAHLAGVRALVLDHLGPGDLPRVQRVTEQLLRAVEGS